MVGKNRKPDLGRIQKRKGLTAMLKKPGFKELQKLKVSLSLVIVHM